MVKAMQVTVGRERQKINLAQASELAKSFQPLGPRVIVHRDPDESLSASGKIFLPDMQRERRATGTVLAVGPGYRQKDGTIRPLDVKPGDRIVFGKYARENADLGDEDILAIPEVDIFAIIKEGG
jgi:chaperonin GroES